MTETQAEAMTPLDHALVQLSTALDHLAKLAGDGALRDLSLEGFLRVTQEFERIRRRMPLVDHELIAAASERDLPGELGQRTMVRVLTSMLRISGAEAFRRVRAAEQLGPRRSMTGDSLPVLRPHLAEAQREGEIGAEQIAVIDRELRKVDGRGFDVDQVDAGEQILAEAARALGPDDLRGVATRVVDAIDPDGSVPDHEHQEARRFFHLRAAADGSFRGDFRLTAEVGQKLKAVLEPLATLRPTSFCLGGAGGATSAEAVDPNEAVGSNETSESVDNRTVSSSGETADDGGGPRVIEPDDRTRGQRLHDAVGQLCDRLLRSGTLPEVGGIPTTVVITIDADQLADRQGHGWFADGSSVDAGLMATLADQAGLAWCVRQSTGEVLALGRTRRLASAGQSLALVARDGGCSFPGCDAEPAWCERHHVVSWLDGGPTDLANLTLLCRYHHHNFEQRGWRCRMTAEALPSWIPPRWIDREQRPIVHPRILLRRHRPRDGLTRLVGGDPP